MIVFSKVIIIIACVISFNPFWWIIGLPLYIIGIATIWTTNDSIKSKRTWSILPISINLFFIFSIIILGNFLPK